jgi:protein tyrosine phosphatase (PTP) superfamily phosphohydrolase (DUF442 family)
MKPPQRIAFDHELAIASKLMRHGRRSEAFRALERAHVLGQDYVVPHVLAHFFMLRVEMQRRNVLAMLGQALRIVLGAVGSAVGIVPRGNTGGTNVSMFKNMPIEPDVAALMAPDAAAAAPRAQPGPGIVRRTLVPGLVLLVGIALGAALYAYAPELLRTSSTEAPMNFVAVSGRIHTSGQPSAAQLGGLHARGYELVVNLAPPTSAGSIADEGMRVAQTGTVYINIPVDWHAPRYDDFLLFSDILDRAGHRQALVHCQINKRASLFTFLYRVVREGVSPDLAYESVTAIWAPDEHWKDFARLVLKRHNIDFEPY